MKLTNVLTCMVALTSAVLMPPSVSASLIAHYEFEELGSTTITADSSGNGHTGTLEGDSVIINDAERGNVYYGEVYDGTPGNGTGVNIDNTVAIPSLAANGGVTLAAWVKRSADNEGASTYAYVIGLGAGGDVPVMSLGIQDGTGAVYGYIEGAGSPDAQVAVAGAAGAVTDGVWTHVAITYDRANDVAKVYVDGTQSGFLS